jgi:DNA (cytosine-5)-methyltransferase 1
LNGRSKLVAVGVFAGAGGLEIGLQAAGFRIALAVERDGVCCETLRVNHRWKVVEEDLEETTAHEILKAAKCRHGRLLLLLPCDRLRLSF